MKNIAVFITRSPDDALGTREMIDMALVFATFNCDVSIIFQDEGVLWTELPEQPLGYPTSLKGKLESLALYDINNIIIHDESLTKFPFVTPLLPAKIKTTRAIKLHCRDCDLLLEA